MISKVDLTLGDGSFGAVADDCGPYGFAQGMKLLYSAAGSVAVVDADADGLHVKITNASMAVTQSGVWTVTANAGTNLNTSLLALEAGNLASIKSKTDNLDAALSTLLKPADTLAAITAVGTVATITNVVHVDDNGGSITVDGSVDVTGSAVSISGGVDVSGSTVGAVVTGSVTANAGTNLNTSLLALEAGGNLAGIKSKTDNLDVALSTLLKAADTLAGITTVGAVTAITNPLPAGTNAIGKLAANSGVTIGAVEIAAAQTLATVTTVSTVTSVTAIANALPAGTNAIGKLAANSGVDIGDVDVTSIVPGTGATNIGKAEDAAHTSGDVGVMVLAVRNDADAAFSGTDLDYTVFSCDSSGNQNVRARKDLTRVTVQSGGLTTSSTAYTAGDQVGTQFTIAGVARASGGGGTIVGVMLVSAADIIGAYDVVISDSSITPASDNAAFAISDADALKAVALVQLAGAFDIGNNRIAQAFNLAVPYVCSGGTSLYANLICRVGHTFFAAATDLQLIVYVERN